MFLGSGPTVVESSRPIHLSPNLFADSRGRYGRVRRVFAGICTVAAINEADNLFTWGANRHGSLALGKSFLDLEFSSFILLMFRSRKRSTISIPSVFTAFGSEVGFGSRSHNHSHRSRLNFC